MEDTPIEKTSSIEEQSNTTTGPSEPELNQESGKITGEVLTSEEIEKENPEEQNESSEDKNLDEEIGTPSSSSVPENDTNCTEKENEKSNIETPIYSPMDVDQSSSNSPENLNEDQTSSNPDKFSDFTKEPSNDVDMDESTHENQLEMESADVDMNSGKDEPADDDEDEEEDGSDEINPLEGSALPEAEIDNEKPLDSSDINDDNLEDNAKTVDESVNEDNLDNESEHSVVDESTVAEADKTAVAEENVIDDESETEPKSNTANKDDSTVEASEEQMETDDVDGSSNQANEKDNGEGAAEDIDGASEQPTEKEDEPSTSESLFDALLNEKDTETDKSVTENPDESAHEHSHVDEDIENFEEGQGADEEICLLPERELTEADKQKAVAAETICDQVDLTEDNDDEPIEPISIEPEDTTIDHDDNENDDVVEINDDSTAINDVENIPIEPRENDIKEIDSVNETCVQCNLEKNCEFSLNLNDEIKFYCSIECVDKLRETNPDKYTIIFKKVFINMILDTQQKCMKCLKNDLCKYRMKIKDEISHFCDNECVNSFAATQSDRYIIRRKRYLVDEAPESDIEHKCLQCDEDKICKYYFKQDDDDMYICQDDCLNLLSKEQSDRIRIKRRSVRVRDLPRRTGGGSATINQEIISIEKEQDPPKMLARSDEDLEAAKSDAASSFIRRCAQCYSVVVQNFKSLYWETLDFCNETCLGQYQNIIGAACTTCSNAVTMASLGKYCVRFGYEIKQFCRSACLDVYKKGLKVCSYCQKDMSGKEDGEMFLVGDKGQYKDFCTQFCMKKYDEISNNKKKSKIEICGVCSKLSPVAVEVILDGSEYNFCTNPCFSAFKFVNNIISEQCQVCKIHFERKSNDSHTIYHDDDHKLFCTKICMNIYIMNNRKIVPCNWCRVKKYNFDMIKKQTQSNQQLMLCSLNCLTLSEVSLNAISMKRSKCDQCDAVKTPQYHLTMSDASIRNFCTYQCVMAFQSQFGKAPLTFSGENQNSVVPTGLPKRVRKDTMVKINQKQIQPKPVQQQQQQQSQVPIISNVTSLATRSGRNKGKLPQQQQQQQSPRIVPLHNLTVNLERVNLETLTKKLPSLTPMRPPPPPKIEYKTQVVTLPPAPKPVTNISTMCQPIMATKGVSCRPTQCTVETQTDESLERRHIIPIPVPIYVPQPMWMYSLPLPMPVPIPMPIPVPIFIPTTRNSAAGIMKEIKKIQDKMPTDPFEAELLMMAEMVAGDKKKNESDSETDEEPQPEEYSIPQPDPVIEGNNAFGEDMLQMALKMASEYDEPAVDLESAMTASTITPHPHIPGHEDEHSSIQQHHMLMMEHHRQNQLAARGRKRSAANTRNVPRNNVTPPSKRSRRSDNQPIIESPPEPPREPVEKPDANMCLKFTFGVNAWKQWVVTKNSDLEKSSIRRKPFKSDLLQLTSDELNYSLCLFVKEVRKPNGSEYAPDTIYYLVLGIQQYLYENGRIDNIFTDTYYDKFTDCLDEVARKFSVLYNDSQYIVTRVEEEHLWECKQLGAHSPHVLLSTLMFFNTKHFNLTTVEEHMQLSFSHIMKHWKRNPNQQATKAAGSRNVLLRFYPPQSSLDANSRKKKVYEQQENEENPLRCPVKLYEFYLSKCPESVKTRNDVFYLQPERSCVPDSPVWYSTQALSKDALCKMLHRVKMVKEINIALLTS